MKTVTYGAFSENFRALKRACKQGLTGCTYSRLSSFSGDFRKKVGRRGGFSRRTVKCGVNREKCGGRAAIEGLHRPGCRGAAALSRPTSGKRRSRPISRVLSRTVIPLGPLSPAASSDLPGNDAGHANVPLFGLAPSGVYLATDRYRRCGALLPHPFTLTAARRPRRSALCCTFRRLTPPRCYLALCPVEPGLSSRHWAARLPGRLRRAL